MSPVLYRKKGRSSQLSVFCRPRFSAPRSFISLSPDPPCPRGMIRIDYDDGTQEVSEIPDSDIVIYPWRPAEQRVRPRSLSQMRAEEEKARTSKSVAEAGKGTENINTTTGNSRKVAVKTEARLPWAAPNNRGKPAQGRQRKGSNSGKQEQARPPKAGSNGRRAPTKAAAAAAATAASSASSPDESEEDDDEDGDDSAEDAQKGSREAKKNGRVQQRNGKAASARGRQRPSSSSRPGPRKRPAGGRQQGRGGSAPKRRRSSGDGELSRRILL